MKTPRRSVTILYIVLVLCALPATAQIRSFDASRLTGRLNRLHEIDFENLLLSSHFPRPLSSQFSPPLPNPLTIDGVTFTDPVRLDNGFCSAPTCIADPDNSHGGNIELFLNRRGTLSFAAAPRWVVLDIQGNGDNPFKLVVTDVRGRKRRVRGQGVLFDQTLLGLFSGRGIRKIELVRVGGSGGPLALARVLFSSHVR